MNLKQGEFDERLSSQVLNELLAESNDAIITVDDVGKIRYASPGISLLLGYDVQVVVGLPS